MKNNHFDQVQIFNSKKYFYFTILSLCLASCTTVEFVRKDTTPEKKAVLRHSIPSNPDKEVKYKAEVDKKANEFCGSPGYTITKEYQALDQADSNVGIGTGFGFGSSSSILIGRSTPSREMASFVEISCKNQSVIK